MLKIRDERDDWGDPIVTMRCTSVKIAVYRCGVQVRKDWDDPDFYLDAEEVDAMITCLNEAKRLIAQPTEHLLSPRKQR